MGKIETHHQHRFSTLVAYRYS